MAKVVKKKNAHDIAKRIHSLILQNFTFETVVRLDADADEHMTAEKNEKKIENNSTKNEKKCDDENGSLFTNQFVRINATSFESSMGLSFVRFILLNRRKTMWLSIFCKIMEFNL